MWRLKLLSQTADSKEIEKIPKQLNMGFLKFGFALLLLFCSALGIANSSHFVINFPADSSKHKIFSLDSLSDEDKALLEEYRDSFLLEVEDIKTVFYKKKFKAIDTSVAFINRSSHVEVGLDFVSRILSNGRASGINGVGFMPSVMYYQRLGFYGSVSAYFFTDSALRKSAPVPLLNLTAGYYTTVLKRWGMGIAYNRSFAFYSDTFQQGILNNSFTVTTGYNFWNYITLSASSSVSWSGNLNKKNKYIFLPPPAPFMPPQRISFDSYTKLLGQEYALNLLVSLRKDFSFYNILGSKVFSITPELNFLFGQDNSILLFNRKIVNDKFFGFLNLEPALSVDWRIKNVEIYAGARLAIPFNQLNTTTNTRELNPKNYYPYAQAGAKYLFMVRKGALRKNKPN